MYIMYVDESGRPEITSITDSSHFVLIGLAIPVQTWRNKTEQITVIKKRYQLEGKEIHTAWMARKYIEQKHIVDFNNLNYDTRRKKVNEERLINLRIKAGLKSTKTLNNLKKNYKKTEDYIHLTYDERMSILHELAALIGSWTDIRLFAEAVDKNFCSPLHSVFKESFIQVVTRFEAFLVNYGKHVGEAQEGLIVQDDNPTEAIRLTNLMKGIYKQGTFWRDITHIVETPLFVDSSLTEMIQLADLCGYATRRFFEKQEEDIFNQIFPRFDRVHDVAVGIRHFTGYNQCSCKVCQAHGRS